jgi:hypothetical protein
MWHGLGEVSLSWPVMWHMLSEVAYWGCVMWYRLGEVDHWLAVTWHCGRAHLLTWTDGRVPRDTRVLRWPNQEMPCGIVIVSGFF